MFAILISFIVLLGSHSSFAHGPDRKFYSIGSKAPAVRLVLPSLEKGSVTQSAGASTFELYLERYPKGTNSQLSLVGPQKKSAVARWFIGKSRADSAELYPLLPPRQLSDSFFVMRTSGPKDGWDLDIEGDSRQWILKNQQELAAIKYPGAFSQYLIVDSVGQVLRLQTGSTHCQNPRLELYFSPQSKSAVELKWCNEKQALASFYIWEKATGYFEALKSKNVAPQMNGPIEIFEYGGSLWTTSQPAPNQRVAIQLIDGQTKVAMASSIDMSKAKKLEPYRFEKPSYNLSPTEQTVVIGVARLKKNSVYFEPLYFKAHGLWLRASEHYLDKVQNGYLESYIVHDGQRIASIQTTPYFYDQSKDAVYKIEPKEILKTPPKPSDHDYVVTTLDKPTYPDPENWRPVSNVSALIIERAKAEILKTLLKCKKISFTDVVTLKPQKYQNSKGDLILGYSLKRDCESENSRNLSLLIPTSGEIIPMNYANQPLSFADLDGDGSSEILFDADFGVDYAYVLYSKGKPW